jgi:carbon storage regulator
MAMLTLTRKIGETIKIGDEIEIVVKEIRKNQVRIGVVAPKDVKIYREEVYENIVAERRAARRPPASSKRPARPLVASPELAEEDVCAADTDAIHLMEK